MAKVRQLRSLSITSGIAVRSLNRVDQESMVKRLQSDPDLPSHGKISSSLLKKCPDALAVRRSVPQTFVIGASQRLANPSLICNAWPLGRLIGFRHILGP